MNPIPLSAPDGQVYGYACGLCHHVRCNAETLRPSEGGPNPKLVEASLIAATRCCTCQMCQGANKLGDWGDEDYLLSQFCRPCRPKAQQEMDERRRACEARCAQRDAAEKVALSSSPDVEAAYSLRAHMRHLSESHWCAGWLVGLEYVLWRMVQGGSRNCSGMGEIPEHDVVHLRELAKICDGWWAWQNGGEGFVQMTEWLKMYEDGEASHPEEIGKPWNV